MALYDENQIKGARKLIKGAFFVLDGPSIGWGEIKREIFSFMTTLQQPRSNILDKHLKEMG